MYFEINGIAAGWGFPIDIFKSATEQPSTQVVVCPAGARRWPPRSVPSPIAVSQSGF
jgi:hypothetical protein